MIFFRNEFFSEAKVKSMNLANNNIYSSCLLLFGLFCFSKESFMVKSFNVAISCIVFMLFYIFGLFIRNFARSFVKKSDFYRSEAISFYLLFLAILNIFINFLLVLSIFYIWGVDLIGCFVCVFGYGFCLSLFKLILLFVLYKAAFTLSDCLIKSVFNRFRKGDVDLFRRFKDFKNILHILSKALINFVALICCFYIFEINAANAMIKSFGLIFAVISFGLKDLAQDFVAGIIVMFEEPFHVGDTVSIDSVTGRVEEITLRLIKVRSFDNSLVYIPFNKIDVVINKNK